MKSSRPTAYSPRPPTIPNAPNAGIDKRRERETVKNTAAIALACLFLNIQAYAQGSQKTRKPGNPAAPAQTYRKKGDQFLAERRYREALEAFQKAAEADPKLAAAHFGMGLAYKRMHADDDAEAALKKGLKIEPKNPAGLGALAQVYLETDRSSEAIKALQTALDVSPERYDLHFWLSRAYEDIGQKDDSKAEYGKAQILAELQAKQNPKDPDVRHVLSLIQNNLGHYEEAIRWGKEETALSPEDAEAHSLLGSNYYNLKKYPEAIEEEKKAVGIDPGYMMYHLQLGAAYRMSGNKEEFEKEYREGLRLAPDYVRHAPKAASRYRFVGWGYYAMLEDKENALIWFQKAVEASPDDYESRMVLGDKYVKLRRCSDAVPQYEAVSKIKPAEPAPWIALTKCHLDLNEPAKAVETGEQAVQLKRDDPFVHNDLGVAYYKTGQYSEAIVQLKEALRLKPDDPTMLLSLAFAYIKAGDRDAAMEQYNVLKNLDEAKAAQILKAIPAPAATSAPSRPEKPDVSGLIEFSNSSSYTAFVSVDRVQVCVLNPGDSCSYSLTGDSERKHGVHIVNSVNQTYDDPVGIKISGCHWNWNGTKSYYINDRGVNFKCRGIGASREQ